ncbi:hypothetical protein FOXB_17288 [Fusarium oxysporum f. sp. conglutinans Fo5176]|uniref:Uncharacterized protein n=1 Tax=Fusarium oxysporum (strain Fo5176) TaxID=660025 RepID=F9GF54_FUSOF|nr:hypothetical protein FOXB_17288 [Fusarium oxysporum f. sp. conglutinans Fo5176]
MAVARFTTFVLMLLFGKILMLEFPGANTHQHAFPF